MRKKKVLKITEVIDLLYPETYDIIAVLLAYGYSITLNKVRIIKYILDNPDTPMNKISKDLNIDYKNVWRICNELRNEELLMHSDSLSQGKSAKIRIKKSPPPTKEEEKAMKIFKSKYMRK